MTDNIKLYGASLTLTLSLGGTLALELLWLVPMGLAGIAVFTVLEYAKIWGLRMIVARRFHEHPPAIGIFAGMAAGLLIMLWLASGLWLAGALTERMVLFIVMFLLVELACLAIPGKGRERQQVPFRLLYASVGKHL